MTIDDMISRMLEKEGGFQKWPSDTGNWYRGRLIGTNKGITPTDLATWRKRTDITEQDMRALSESEARAIYRGLYYERSKIDLLPDVLEPAVFDYVLHSGAHGIKALQRTLNAFGFLCDVDGGVGPQTVRQSFAALADVPATILLMAYLNERRAFLYDAAQRPGQDVFLKGWLARVDKLEQELIGGLSPNVVA